VLAGVSRESWTSCSRWHHSRWQYQHLIRKWRRCPRQRYTHKPRVATAFVTVQWVCFPFQYQACWDLLSGYHETECFHCFRGLPSPLWSIF
jgi:hypothetical protein